MPKKTQNTAVATNRQAAKGKAIDRKTAESLFKVDVFDRIKTFANTTNGKTYTILGLTFVMLALLLLFAFRPTLKTIFELDRKIKEYEDTSNTLERKYQFLLELTHAYSDSVDNADNPGNKEQIELLDQAVMPSSPTQDVLYDDFNAMGESTGVTIEGIQSSTSNIPSEVAFTGVGATRVTVSINGTRDQNLNFVSALYDYPRPLVIDSVSLTQSETEETIYRASIVLYSFYFIETTE